MYNEAADGAFCIVSVIFCRNQAGEGQFVNVPFLTWQKKAMKCKDHEQTKYHQEMLQLVEEFVHTVEQPETTVACMVDHR